jgi:hypothetical protein
VTDPRQTEGMRSVRLSLSTLLALSMLPLAAHAANINVPAGDEAALVAAIDTANGNGQDDVITLGAGSSYTFTAANNPLNALPVVTSKITIEGNGAFIERQAGSPEFRLIDVGDGGDLTLDGVVVRGGAVTYNAPLVEFNNGGGGIRLFGIGTLTLTSTSVTQNTCNGNVCQGGGILVFPLGQAFGPQGASPPGNARAVLVDSVVSENFAGTGGGISLRDNFQILELTRTTVRDNDGIEGGGLTCNGDDRVTITDSTFSGNGVSELVEGGALGGGLLDYGGSTYTITGTTFTGNTATGASASPASTDVRGAAIAEAGGASFTIANSTFTGNTVTNTDVGLADGAAIHGEGGIGATWNLNNVTIAGNTVSGPGGSGAGIAIETGTLTIRNSIVAGNTAAANADCVFAGTNFSSVTSQGHNIIGTTDGCAFTATTGDQIGADPKLGPLTNHGGPTETMALLSGSAALDTGDPAVPGSGGTACEATDQRGTTRPQGTACDIGAYEAGGTPTTTTTLPDDECGEPVPTYESIDCRLDALIEQLEAADDLGKVKTSLLRSSTAAREKKVAAENLDPSDTKKQKKLLKKAIRKMISYNIRIGSRNARRQITDAALRADLDAQGDSILGDLKALMRSL